MAAEAGGGGAPTTADYLTGTAQAGLSAEIVVGPTPGGELGGTWAAPTVDATHSGSAHHAQAHDHSAAGDGQTLTPATLNIPHAAVPAQTGEGQAVWDDDGDFLTIGTGAGRKSLVNTDDSRLTDARTPLAHAATHASAGSDPTTGVAGPDANVAIDAAGAAGTLNTMARSAHGHQVVTTDAPSGAVDTIDAAPTAAATGAIARAAHGHRVNTTDAPSGANDVIDAAPTAGATGAIARATHGHRLDTYATAAAAVGTAAAGTAGTAPSRGNHVHPTGAGTPSTQAFGDAAVVGSGPAAAMTDHKHAMPAVPGTIKNVSGASATNSTTTAADITGLTFATVAGVKYWFRAVLIVTTAATTNAILLSVNHSTAITSIRIITQTPIESPATGGYGANTQSALDAFPGWTTGPGATTGIAIIEGFVTINTAGTLAMRFKSSAAALVSVAVGSYLMIQPVA